MKIIRFLGHGESIDLSYRLIEGILAHPFVKSHNLFVLADKSLQVFLGRTVALSILKLGVDLLKLGPELLSGLMKLVGIATFD